VETGEYFPYLKHREARGWEVLEKGLKAMKLNKLPKEELEVGKQELEQLLACKDICAWGECYRKRPKE